MQASNVEEFLRMRMRLHILSDRGKIPTYVGLRNTCIYIIYYIYIVWQIFIYIYKMYVKKYSDKTNNGIIGYYVHHE